MKTVMQFLGILLLLHVIQLQGLKAQDLTGIWRGHFRSNDIPERLAGNYDDRYKMEVQIAQTHNKFEAVTYSYKSTEFYGKAEATGSLNPQSRKVLLKEGKLLEVRFSSGSVCIMTCFMTYSKLGDDEYLQGTYYSVNAQDSNSNCGKGSIFLHRVVESDFRKEPFLEKKERELLANKKKNDSPTPKSDSTQAEKPLVRTIPVPKKAGTPKIASNKPPAIKKSIPTSPKMVVPPPEKKSTPLVTAPNQHITRDTNMKISQPDIAVSIPLILKTRTNELLKTITVNHDQIELRIYDDGAVDNDTVSVYYDNKLVISRARLSDEPITLKIKVEPSDKPHQLIMVAENLGEIPPNTSLMVVRDGEKRYEERIISNEQKNVEINFIYKKIE